ncbi:MAG: DUF4292 domain-containing protein [Bacteroidota bacterium]
MSKYLGRTTLLLLVIAFAASCKMPKRPTRRKLRKEPAQIVVLHTDTAAINKALPPDSLTLINNAKKALINKLMVLWDKKVDYTTFSGKARMHFVGEEDKQEFTAHFRMKRDSAVWVSITALGLQAARIYITPDSVRYINYLRKEVAVLPFSKAYNLLPRSMDFRTLQSLIIGNALQSEGTITDATDFGGTWSLQMMNKDFVQEISYNKQDSTMRTGQLRSQMQKGIASVMQYGNYDTTQGRKFAFSRTINVVDTSGAQYYLDMNFLNVTFDEQVDFPFPIPKNYERR